MAETTGLVQRLTVAPQFATACAWIGPTPANTALLFVTRLAGDPAEIGAFRSSMIDALTAAAVSRREVVATHGTGSGRITGLRIES
jgi:hypothetical protein